LHRMPAPHEPAQVPVADEVLGEEDQVEGLGVGRIDRLRDPAEAVEQTEFGANMKVHEVVWGQGRQGTSTVAGWIRRCGPTVPRFRVRSGWSR
jgi:hypothetical protein